MGKKGWRKTFWMEKISKVVISTWNASFNPLSLIIVFSFIDNGLIMHFKISRLRSYDNIKRNCSDFDNFDVYFSFFFHLIYSYISKGTATKSFQSNTVNTNICSTSCLKCFLNLEISLIKIIYLHKRTSHFPLLKFSAYLIHWLIACIAQTRIISDTCSTLTPTEALVDSSVLFPFLFIWKVCAACMCCCSHCCSVYERDIWFDFESKVFKLKRKRCVNYYTLEQLK